MSDPLDERFRDFATGTPAMNPASPSSIRQRGDRLRRRRTALTAAGAALTVALIATPVVVLTSGGSDDVQPAPPSPTVTDPPSEDPDQPTETTSADAPVATEIPDDFPLAAGYPTTNGNDGTPVEVTDTAGVPTILACEAPVWSADDVDAVDVAGAFYSGEAEDSRGRTLILYSSIERAVANLEDQIVAGVTACGDDGGPDGSRWDVETAEDGTTIVTKQYLSGGQPIPGLEVYLLTRVDNALLVDWNSGEGGATDASRDASIDFALEQQTEVVTAMQQFSIPSSGGDGGESGEQADELPDDVLAAGDLPVRERLAPWERAPYPDVPVIACQPGTSFSGEFLGQADFTAEIAPEPGTTGGGGTSSEIRVAMYQYDSEDAAGAASAVVADWFTECDAPAQMDRSEMTRQGDVVRGPGTRRYATWVYAAPERCSDDCDAAWFDRMGVVQDGDRIAVVTFREVGGPLEPEGLDATMADLLEVLRGALPRA